MLSAVLLFAPAVPVAKPMPEPVEIIVTARRSKCRVRLANRVLSDKELNARADEWAKGTAVRVIAPERLGYKCLAKIAFRLGDRGVRLIEFVDRPDQIRPRP